MTVQITSASPQALRLDSAPEVLRKRFLGYFIGSKTPTAIPEGIFGGRRIRVGSLILTLILMKKSAVVLENRKPCLLNSM